MNLIIKLFFLVQLAGFAFSSFGQSTDMQNIFPRIEVYTEYDYSSRLTGSDQTTDVIGRTVYMGRRIQELYISRTSYVLEDSLVEVLFNQTMYFLPYFKEVKNVTTLQRYFELDKSKHIPEHKKQFPFHMEGYKEYSAQNRLYFQTIIEYQMKPPSRVEVVWLNEEQWFINNVFYSVDLSTFELTKNKRVEEKLIKGSMVDFIRFSNIIQPKLSEGMNYLRIPAEMFELDPSKTILMVSLSPGSPGTISYDYKLDGNGKLHGYSSRYPSKKLKHYEVVSIMNQINAIDFEGYAKNERLAPFVHDGQTETVRAYSNGSLRSVSSSSGGDPMAQIVSDFADRMIRFFKGEIPVEFNASF